MKRKPKTGDIRLVREPKYGYRKGFIYQVEEYLLFTGWLFLAEIRDYKDALLFIRVKKDGTYQQGYNEAMKLHYRSGR